MKIPLTPAVIMCPEPPPHGTKPLVGNMIHRVEMPAESTEHVAGEFRKLGIEPLVCHYAFWRMVTQVTWVNVLNERDKRSVPYQVVTTLN